MTINQDLASWGESPATPQEEAQADQLAAALECIERGEQPPTQEEQFLDGLKSVSRMTASFRHEAGLLDAERQQQWATRVPTTALPIEPTSPLSDKYRVLSVLGHGAFGEVWLAEETQIAGSLVAIKTLRPGGDPATAPERLSALRREATVLRDLRHPNIVPVYTWEQRGDEHYLVLRYVRGGSLEDRLTHGALPWEDATRYVADVAEGLRHAHERGVVHRDIKPANILIDAEKDEAMLTDFGIAGRLAGPDGLIAGTPLYMAPEAFDGQLSQKADVYSLAATLFRLVTKEYPFNLPMGTKKLNTASVAQLRAEVARGLDLDDPRLNHLPDALIRLIRDGLASEDGRRPSMDRFAEALRTGLNQSLADSVMPAGIAEAPVSLHLRVSRETAPGIYEPLTALVHLLPKIRNMVKPPRPPQMALRTGDRVRIEVLASQTGYVTVFNVGSSGDLNLLFPDESLPLPALPTVRADEPLHILDVEMYPPTGRERLIAVWSRQPLPVQLKDLHDAVIQGQAPVPSAYQATRNMVRVKKMVARLAPSDWHAVVLEVEHMALNTPGHVTRPTS